MEPMINATEYAHEPVKSDEIVRQYAHHATMLDVNRVLETTPDLYHVGTPMNCPGKSCEQVRRYWIIRRVKETELRAELNS